MTDWSIKGPALLVAIEAQQHQIVIVTRQRDRLLAAAKALLPYAKEEIRLLQHDANKDSTYKANAMDGMKHLTQAQTAIADCEEGK